MTATMGEQWECDSGEQHRSPVLLCDNFPGVRSARVSYVVKDFGLLNRSLDLRYSSLKLLLAPSSQLEE